MLPLGGPSCAVCVMQPLDTVSAPRRAPPAPPRSAAGAVSPPPRGRAARLTRTDEFPHLYATTGS